MHRLEPDPHTAPVVQWMFAQRKAGHSLAQSYQLRQVTGPPGPRN